MDQYLASTEIIDWQSPAVLGLARELAADQSEPTDIARACFEYVRDRITHSGDARAAVTTCRASDVLHHATGWCFAKSHLLAALLRANGIPAGLCYQRLRRDDGRGFTLHGLNAAHLPPHGWYRLDARGNKPGVAAEFDPPKEHLAWPIDSPGEHTLPEIWPTPLPIVLQCLANHQGWKQVQDNLPDVAVIGG